jgi:iron(III) transport system substrate-binding protein
VSGRESVARPLCGRVAWVAALALAVVAGASGCRVELGSPGAEARGAGACGGPPAGELWIYASVYQHVVDDLDKLLRQRLPGVEPRWFTGGSEKVIQRLDAELSAGGSRADLLLISDPFYFERLGQEGKLLPYVPPRALRVPRELVGTDGAWLTSRAAVMVLVYNTRLLDEARAPRGFRALLDPAWKGKLIMGDPLASGTFFTSIAVLHDAFGEAYFHGLRANQITSTGGNSAVIERVASGEYSAGMVLLENVLTSQRKGAPLAFVIPEEGAIIIPGPSAILAGSHNPIAAKAAMDVVYSEEGQALMVRGDMYAADPGQPPPAGAPPWPVVSTGTLAWGLERLHRIGPRTGQLRADFHRIVQQ